jgi:hypothetical protein
MCCIGVFSASLLSGFNFPYVKGSKVQFLCVICGLHSVAEERYGFLGYDAVFIGYLFPAFGRTFVPPSPTNQHGIIHLHSFCSLCYDRSVTSSKASSPQGAI